MAYSREFASYVEELFEGFGAVRIKGMFGGAGVYYEDIMFALIFEDVLYLKADGEFVEALKEQGSTAWTYTAKRDGVAREMGYWSLPDTAADDRDEAAGLARQAFEVALRKKKSKKKPAAKRQAKSI